MNSNSIKNIINFIILNVIQIFSIIPVIIVILGTILGLIIFIFVSYQQDNIFPGILFIVFILLVTFYSLSLPLKLIIYPILYEYLKPTNIIHKLFERIRTKKSTAITVLGITTIIDVLVYLYIPKISIASDDIVIQLYKKSQLFGLTACILSLLLWFKIRKPQHNGKRLLWFYLFLTIVFLGILFIFREYVMDLF